MQFCESGAPNRDSKRGCKNRFQEELLKNIRFQTIVEQHLKEHD